MTIRLRTRQRMINRLALLAHWSVRRKLNRVSSVQFSYVALYNSVTSFVNRWNSCADCLVVVLRIHNTFILLFIY